MEMIKMPVPSDIQKFAAELNCVVTYRGVMLDAFEEQFSVRDTTTGTQYTCYGIDDVEQCLEWIEMG